MGLINLIFLSMYTMSTIIALHLYIGWQHVGWAKVILLFLIINCILKYIDFRYHLKDALLEGGVPFNKAYNMTPFEYQSTDPRFNKLFNEAMANGSTLVMKKILETYNGFADLRSLVDLGGGTGMIANLIVSKYPLIKAINFDLKHVIDDAPPFPGWYMSIVSVIYLSKIWQTSSFLLVIIVTTNLGVQHVGGDMFASVPNADAIFMKVCTLSAH